MSKNTVELTVWQEPSGRRWGWMLKEGRKVLAGGYETTEQDAKNSAQVTADALEKRIEKSSQFLT